MKKCPDCKTPLETSSGPGRVMTYRGVQGYHVPEEVSFQVCPNCKIEWLTEDQSKALGAVFEAQRLDRLLENHELDPFFLQCLRTSAGYPDLVEQFDRLCGTNLLGKGTGLELMIDKASGRENDDLKKFTEFVRDYVYAPLIRQRLGVEPADGTHRESP